MKELKVRYREDVEAWDWKKLRAELLEELAICELEECGMREARMFIGTVQALTPSGKVYAPFAAGVLDVCEVCAGEGRIPNPTYSEETCQKVKQTEAALRLACKAKFGLYADYKWPAIELQTLKRLEETIEAAGMTITCPHCEGAGSREAYLDQLWHEALEHSATERGLFITTGEDDPCDMFVGLAMDEDERQDTYDKKETT